MNILNYINWSPSPEMFSIGAMSIRWYGLLFAGGLLLGYQIMKKIYKQESIKPELLDTLFIYAVVAIVVGARLGHVIFYDWGYYSKNFVEIFKIWKGGLASHGGTIGLIIAMLIYTRRILKKPFLWLTDRLVIAIALTSSMIRLGNLMNSEIIGKPTTVAWAFIFERVDAIPRHPAQLYESLFYLVTFFTISFIYVKTNAKNKQGLITGIFFTLVFGFRFFIEFVKENQEAFEHGMILNMGQILSIPFIILGIVLIVVAKRKGK